MKIPLYESLCRSGGGGGGGYIEALVVLALLASSSRAPGLKEASCLGPPLLHGLPPVKDNSSPSNEPVKIKNTIE